MRNYYLPKIHSLFTLISIWRRGGEGGGEILAIRYAPMTPHKSHYTETKLEGFMWSHPSITCQYLTPNLQEDAVFWQVGFVYGALLGYLSKSHNFID